MTGLWTGLGGYVTMMSQWRLWGEGSCKCYHGDGRLGDLMQRWEGLRFEQEGDRGLVSGYEGALLQTAAVVAKYREKIIINRKSNKFNSMPTLHVTR